MNKTRLNRISTALWMAALSLSPPTSADAATLHVSPSGFDSNPGTLSLPFRQIRKGVSVAAAGDTVLVADGVYLGFDVRSKQGAAGAPITIRATGSSAEVVPTADRSDNRDTIFITYSNHIIIEGFRSFNANRAAVRLDSSHFVTVRDCTFGNNGTWGIFTNNSDDSLFENNECYGSVNEHGIYVSNSSMRPTVRGNRLHDNAGCGLHMNGDLSMGPPGIIAGGLVESNVVWNNGALGGAGINMDGPQDMVVRNNLLFNNSAGGITMYRIDAAEGPRNVQILNNTVTMPSNGRWAVLISKSTGLITLRNNILLHAGSRGGINFVNSTDVSNTDSDFNILDRVTPNDGVTIYNLAQWRATGHDTYSLSAAASALFVNPSANDYHLLAGSPAIDSGTVVELHQDIEGSTRPSGAGFDIGAYEAKAAQFSPPLLTLLNPDSARAGGAAFVLTVTGTGFQSGAALTWSGSARSTTVDSTTQIRAAINAADIATAGTVDITVTNPGSPPSNTLRFSIFQHSVAASPGTVEAGQAVNVSWTAPPGSSVTDWIGLFRVGEGNFNWLQYRYTYGTTTGIVTFNMPSSPGLYEFRYLLNNGYSSVAVSNPVTVSAPSGYSVTITGGSYAPGQMVPFTWTAPSGRPAVDWIGLFEVGAGNGQYISWIYTGGAVFGTGSMKAPLAAGVYEFRYLLNNGYTDAALSSSFTVSP